MNAENRITAFPPLPLARIACLPLQVQVLDRLADLLLDADEVLELLRTEDARTMHWIEPNVRRVFDDVNEIMKRLSH